MAARERVRERAPAPERAGDGAAREPAPEGREGGRVPPEVEALLRRSAGRPLEPEVRGWMEGCFGYDFARVRVHTDRDAADAARALDAHALARGEHVYFAAGLYRPSTHAGRRLLAHELTHTLQQAPDAPRPVVQRRGAAGIATGLLETEAETAARRVAAGERVPQGSVSVAARHLRRPPSTDPARPPREPSGAEAPDAAVRTLAAEVYRVLGADPDDRAGRARRLLESASPATREAALSAVRARLTPAERARLADTLTALATPEPAAAEAPAGAEGATREAPGGDAALTEGPAASDPAAAPEPAVAPPAPAPAPLGTRLLDALGRLFGAGRRTGPAAPDVTPEAPPQAATQAPAPEELAARAEEDPDAEAEADAEEAPPVEAPEAEGAAGEAEAAPEREAEARGGGEASQAAAAGAVPDAGGDAAPAQPDTGPADRVDGYFAEKDREDDEREAEARRQEAEAEASPAGAAGPAPALAEAAPSPVDETTDADVLADRARRDAERAAEAAEPAGGEGAAPPAPEPAPPIETEPAAADLDEEPEEAALPEAPGGGADLGGGYEAPEVEVSSAAVEAPAAPDLAAGPAPDAAGGAGEGGAAEDPEISAMLAEGAGDAEYSGGGGGGGGSAIPEPPAPAVPDLSGAEPEEAMAQASALPPAQMQAALAGVTAAATRTGGAQRDDLAASPPEMEAPTGAPTAAEMAAESAAEEGGGSAAAQRVERAPAGEDVPVASPDPLPPAPENPTARVSAPQVGGGAEGELSEQDVRALQSSIRTLPTSDPALHAQVGPAPRLVLEGNADPARAQEQRAELNLSVGAAHADGVADVARPAGENEIYPDLPPATLTAEVAGGGGGGAPAGGGGGGEGGAGAAAVDDAVGIIAQEERGDQVQAAASGAQGEMQAARADHAEQADQAHADAQAEIDTMVQDSAAEQRGVRTEARAEVRDQRRQWGEAQQEAVDDAHADADAAGREGARTIGEAAQRGRREAAAQVAEGNRQVAQARTEAETHAQRERRRGEEEGSGFFGWLASRARRFFNAIKEGIQRAFEAARRRVAQAIEAAQRWAAEKIEQARQAIVAGIRWVGDRMLAIGDVLLARFPGLRDRFRSAIEAGVQWAEDRVNELAEGLQRGVKALLDGLGAALNGLLNLLEAGLLAAVDAVASAVEGAIRFARSVVDALAQFAALVRDVAADPGGWIRNLGAAVMDGVRNHLWTALKTAVREWFNSKVEEVVGLGAAVWGMLTQGGITLAAIGRMVWGGLKAAIPPALLAILVEKLVAMIVPAAGAIMAIVEGVMAAWGTVSRIIAAFSAFFAFLRAVRGGGAGPLFATAVAAGAVAVIDFAANFLIARLRRPAGALAARIRALAQRIGQRLRRVLGRRRRGAGRRRPGAGRRRGGREAPGRRRRPGQRHPSGRRRPQRRGNASQRRQRRDQRGRDRQRALQDRLDRAVRAIRPQADTLLRRGTSSMYLRARLLYWRVRYRLSALTIGPSGQIRARVNPEALVIGTRRLTALELGRALEPVIRRAEAAFIRQVEATRTDEERERIRSAEETLRTGGDAPLPSMNRVEQALLLRRIREGQVPVATGGNMVRLGEAANIQVRDPGNFGMFYLMAGPAHRNYPALIRSITRLSGRLGIPESQIHHVMNAPNDAELNRRLQAALGSATGGDRTERAELGRMTRSAGALTQALETGRAGGQMVTGATAGELAARGQATTQEVLGRSGELASMTHGRATAGVEQERREAEGRPAPRSETASRRAALRTARTERQRRIGAVFARLANRVRDGNLTAKDGGFDFGPLVAALEQWLQQHLRGLPLNDPELRAAEARLQAQIVAFMNSFHGR
jgi:hypothetical protein